MKKIICLLSIFSSTAFAHSGTMIITHSGNDVQCNNWGWVHQGFRIYWQDIVCTPLQLKTFSGDVLSVETTDVCGKDGIASYTYGYLINGSDKAIKFSGCVKSGDESFNVF